MEPQPNSKGEGSRLDGAVSMLGCSFANGKTTNVSNNQTLCAIKAEILVKN